MDTIKNNHELYFGLSPCIKKAKCYINVATTGCCAVLLLGESGTGKSLIAQWIHRHSSRRDREFTGINCSGLKGDLLKSELFGHVRGAFTGAVSDRQGLIEMADGGTLFLDEIGDLDISVQCQLLKAIEEKTYRRVGENIQRTSDFRLICATNRNLFEAIEEKTFREDLYYRINTLTISLPPLVKRSEDIPGLLNHLLTKMGYAGSPLKDDVIEALSQHRWRGNVRELRNALERALAFAQGKNLTLEHFSDVFEETSIALMENEAFPAEERKKQTVNWSLSKWEKAHIMRTLHHFGSDKIKTSAALGISLSSLYRKLNGMYKNNAGKVVDP
ncbi:MAG: sigma-54 dependent transcriptional regulator [Chitinispirillales bacterium]|jgi:transcriptional regulator with PAS, ATPase and Fis domain|nr:sigma-54 dependent transcriptional regulator [Chitinispirillales bacterium]